VLVKFSCVDLAGLDDENVGAWTTAREGAEKEHGDVDITVVGPDEVMRAAMKWQVLLTNAVHAGNAPMVGVGGGPSNSNLWGFPGKRGGTIDALGRPG
jgi:hypothetical protein